MKPETISLDDLKKIGLRYIQIHVVLGKKIGGEKLFMSQGIVKGPFNEHGEVLVHNPYLDTGNRYTLPETIVGEKEAKMENFHRAFLNTPENHEYLISLCERESIWEFFKLVGIKPTLARRRLPQIYEDAERRKEEEKIYKH